MTRPRSATAASGAMVMAVVLSGCAAIGVERNTFEASPLPAIADGSAAAALAAIDATVNQANATRDPELLATVYADPLLAVEVAAYALDATADPENTDPPPEVEHTDPTVFVPRIARYPKWFVTASEVRPDAPLRLDVIGRDTAASAWITYLSTDLLADVPFPELALDDAGYVVPVSSAEYANLAAGSINEIAAAHAAALGGSDDPTGEAATFIGDAWTTARQSADAERGTTVADAAQVQVTYDVTGVLPQALKTADDGTLVFYVLSEEVVYTVQPTFFLQLDEATAALVGTAEITTSLTERWAIQLAVYVPPDAGDTARVVGARVARVGLSGS